MRLAMLLVTPTPDAMKRQRQVHVNGRDYTLSEYVGAAPLRGHYQPGNEVNDNGMPQGFLVHQPPGATTPAHFHEPNQFQVFVGGKGRIGAFPAVPLTVQYANGHTPYGPIVAGPEGVEYFTLRQRWDPGAKYLPASRDKLVKGNQRTRVKGNLPVSSEVERQARKDIAIETVFAPEPDGLAGSLYRMGPGQSARMPDPAGTGGIYFVVTEGSVMHDGQDLPRLSTIYSSHEEARVTLHAGASGADVLVLHFPMLAP
jgi:hypothetical protein